MRGGKYLAEERGAFHLESPAVHVPTVEPCIEVARAPLFEIAASHDGQPAMDWLRVFMSLWNREMAG